MFRHVANILSNDNKSAVTTVATDVIFVYVFKMLVAIEDFVMWLITFYGGVVV